MKNKIGIVEKLKKGEVVYGLANVYPASSIIENLCQDWDFVWIDVQHGQHTFDSVLHALQAAKAVETDTVVRVYENSYGVIGRYLDLAPTAMMFPMINTVEQAKQIIDFSYTKPIGSRSFGGRRVIDLYGRTYHIDRKPFIIAQVETKEAVENCEDIIALDGIDMLFVGAADLKLDMRIPLCESVLENEELFAVMERVMKAAKSHNKYCGCVMINVDDIKKITKMGYQLIACGTDSGFIEKQSTEMLRLLKPDYIPRNS